ncbi:MAG: hypothetical protein ACJA1A_003434, partial [Saprospiraceae bacterium]
ENEENLDLASISHSPFKGSTIPLSPLAKSRSDFFKSDLFFVWQSLISLRLIEVFETKKYENEENQDLASISHSPFKGSTIPLSPLAKSRSDFFKSDLFLFGKV